MHPFFLQLFNRLLRGEDHKFDLPAFGFALHFVHHWQRAGASAHHEPAAFPGYGLLWGDRRVAEGIPELFGRLLFASADLAPVDHHVVGVSGAVDAN